MNDNCKEGSNDKNKHKNRNSRQMVPTQACWENECLGIKSFQQPPTPFPLSLPQTKQKSVKSLKHQQIQIMICDLMIFLDFTKLKNNTKKKAPWWIFCDQFPLGSLIYASCKCALHKCNLSVQYHLNDDGLKVRIIYLHFDLTEELCFPASGHICSTGTSYGSVLSVQHKQTSYWTICL